MKHLNSIKQKGKLNSLYGTVWYFNPLTMQSRKFSKDEKVPDGWIKGRKILKSKQFEKCKEHIVEYEKHPNLCEYCSLPIKYDRRFYKTCCREHGKLLRNLHNHETLLFRHSSGGIRLGSGRGKHGWYKSYWCDSSWELAWVIYNLDHGVKFERCKEKFEYLFEGKKHNYYPDFILKNGIFVEIKGLEHSEMWKAKLQQFPKDKMLQVIGKNEIKKYLEYVIQKYGKDFISLYEK